MKNLFLISVALIGFQVFIEAQSCLPDGIDFNTQAEIDNFQADYPGCHEIEGYLRVYSQSNMDITNLDGLSSLISVNGSLTIMADKLTDLSGLDNLWHVGGLEIKYCDELENLHGLENLHSSEWIWIAENNSLTDVLALSDMTIQQGGSITIDKNPSLQNLTGLENIYEPYSLVITNNLSLTGLTAFSHITYPGSLRITGNPLLAGLNGLETMVQAGYVEIIDCPLLPDLSGISNLESTTDYTKISGDSSLPDLTGLGNLASPNSLYIEHNASLASLDGLPFYDSIPGDLHLKYNYALNDLSALENLQYVGGEFLIYVDTSLTSLSSLANLNHIGNDLIIVYNYQLVNFDGLNNLEYVGDWLELTGNRLITNLEGLDNLTTIRGTLYVSLNRSLTSFTGMDNLTEIGAYYQGALHISLNDALHDLNGLENITSVGGDLEIWNNPALASLSGIENLVHAGGIDIRGNNLLTDLNEINNIGEGDLNALLLMDNPVLSSCASPAVCYYIDHPTGSLHIEGNLTGCNTTEEIDSACAHLYVNEESENQAFTISPNPAGATLFVNLSGSGKSVHVILEIFDADGQLVYSVPEYITGAVIDISFLKTGTYLVRSRDGNSISYGKLIKI